MKFSRYLWFVVLATSLLVFNTPVQAQPNDVPSAYDVIAAVNALRASKGLATWQVSSGLMGTAQSQSDYQASLGTWTHTGADGSAPHDRILGAGYYGYENVAIINSSQDLNYLIYTLWSDSIHWNLMVNTQYTYCGVGVTTKAGMTYITLDAGYVSGHPGSSSSSSVVSGTTVPGAPTATPNRIQPVITATPQDDGKVVHVVQPGQALSSIAVAYGVKVAYIQNLNNIAIDNYTIKVGQKLVIFPAYTPTLSPTVTDTPPPPTRTLAPTNTPGPPPATFTPSPTASLTPLPLLPKIPALASNQRQTIGIILVVVCGLGLSGVLASRFLKKK